MVVLIQLMKSNAVPEDRTIFISLSWTGKKIHSRIFVFATKQQHWAVHTTWMITEIFNYNLNGTTGTKGCKLYQSSSNHAAISDNHFFYLHFFEHMILVIFGKWIVCTGWNIRLYYIMVQMSSRMLTLKLSKSIRRSSDYNNSYFFYHGSKIGLPRLI